MSWNRKQEERAKVEKDRLARCARADDRWPAKLYPHRNALCRGISPLHCLCLMDPSGKNNPLYLAAMEKGPRMCWDRIREVVESDCPEEDVPEVLRAALVAWVGSAGGAGGGAADTGYGIRDTGCGVEEEDAVDLRRAS